LDDKEIPEMGLWIKDSPPIRVTRIDHCIRINKPLGLGGSGGEDNIPPPNPLLLLCSYQHYHLTHIVDYSVSYSLKLRRALESMREDGL
jgi:hypothetical protein